MDLSVEILHDAHVTLEIAQSRLPSNVTTVRDVKLALEFVDALEEFLRIRMIVEKIHTWI
tara:strand:- start:95 stop:274 length:180 start_codon:yes stop_codon:yes gene_type:complete